MEKSAVISECGLYRYQLSRRWNNGPFVTFIMLNPSTADANQDDPTIRRCIGFAQAWGFAGLHVGNLFAFRATDPAAIKAQGALAIGPDNDTHLAVLSFGLPVIAAWGCHGKFMGRDQAVRTLLRENKVYALGFTKDEHPKHPLYLPNGIKPVSWDLTRVPAGA